MAGQTVKETSIEELLKVIKKFKPSYEKEGWLRWLSQYDETGYYKRLPGMGYSAKFMYNHNASPLGMIWLIEALGVDKKIIHSAKSDLAQAERKGIRNVHVLSAMVRKRVPWDIVDTALAKRSRALNKTPKHN